MTPPALRIVSFLLATAAALLLLVVLLHGPPVRQQPLQAGSPGSGRREIAACQEPAARPESWPHASPLPNVRGFLDAIVPLGEALLAAAGLLIVLRVRSRRRRLGRMRRVRIVPSHFDEASPLQVRKLADVLHAQCSAPWWRRPWHGQESMALGWHTTTGVEQGREELLTLACLPERFDHLAAALAGAYPDVRLADDVDALQRLACARHIVRLKKRTSFLERLATSKNYEHSIADTILSTLAALEEPASVELALTPAPASFRALARQALKRREQALQREDRLHVDAIGVDSAVEDKEIKGALELIHAPLFWFELRVGAPTRATARRVAATLAAATAENALAPRELRFPWLDRAGIAPLRRRLYAARMEAGTGNPIPSFTRNVIGSPELATLWQMPSGRAKAARLRRSATPRAPAPPELHRHPRLGLLKDERGPFGLAARDLGVYGLAAVGGTNMGKTSALLRAFQILTGELDAAGVILDPKGDLHDAVLSALPDRPGRQIHIIDFRSPEAGWNPLLTLRAPMTVASGVVEALKDINEPGAIQARSSEFLREAAIAVIAAELAAGRAPTFWHMHHLLRPSARDYRSWVVGQLDSIPALASTALYWREFQRELLDPATSVTATALAAPRNKLRVLFTGRIDTVFRHPHALDFEELLGNRDILVVRGDLGGMEAETIMAMKLMLNGVHHALTHQLQRSEEERVPLVLAVDEFHLLATDTYARSLAVLRSAGLMPLAGWQHSAQMTGSVRAAVRSLLRNRLQFATAELLDAEEAVALLREAHTSSERPDPTDRLRVRFGTDQILRLPPHHAACSLMPNGSRCSGCIGETFPIPIDPQRIARRREDQRVRGAGPVEPLDPPEDVAERYPDNQEPDEPRWRAEPATPGQHRLIRVRAERAGLLADLTRLLQEHAGAQALDRLTKGDVDPVLRAIDNADQQQAPRTATEPAVVLDESYALPEADPNGDPLF